MNQTDTIKIQCSWQWWKNGECALSYLRTVQQYADANGLKFGPDVNPYEQRKTLANYELFAAAKN